MIKNLLSVAIMVLAANFIDAQNLDTTFGTNGKTITSFGPAESNLNTIVLQPDGKILACGSYYTYVSNPFSISNQVALSRYNADGSPDVEFGALGKVLLPIGSDADNENNTVKVLSDGKILVMANNTVRVTQFGTTNDYALLKFNQNGTPDNSFGNNGILFVNYAGHFNRALAMAVQADQKIVLVGNSEQISTSDYGNFVAVRLNADGSKDTTFGNNGRADFNFGTVISTSQPTADHSETVTVQPDGKILIGGYSAEESQPAKAALLRLNSDGTPDETFGFNGRATTAFDNHVTITSIQLWPDGKILASGTYFYNDDSNTKIFATKYHADGSLDATFGNDGKVILYSNYNDPMFVSMASLLQSDGKILVSGWGANGNDNHDEIFDALVIRLNADGSADTGFGNNGYLWSGFGQDMIANDLLLQPNGKLLLGGTTTAVNTANEFILWRYEDVNLASRQFDEAKFIVSPNPFRNILNVDFKMTQNELLSFELIDQTGRRIEQLYSGNFNIGQNSKQFELPQLPNGIYFLNISGRQISKTIPIVK